MTVVVEPAIPVLEAIGLYHIYRDNELETIAVRDVALSIARGEWVAVVGPSGSGKSTLLNVLCGLATPTAGQIIMSHRDIGRADEAERAELRSTRIGVMLQRDNLHPLLTVQENIALPLELRGTPGRKRARDLVVRVGISGRSGHRPHQLSGGEAQRAALAVALAPSPDLLLADEPTGELDELTTELILDLLDSVRAETSLSILTVTHNPQVAARADRTFTMNNGTLTERPS